MSKDWLCDGGRKRQREKNKSLRDTSSISLLAVSFEIAPFFPIDFVTVLICAGLNLSPGDKPAVVEIGKERDSVEVADPVIVLTRHRRGTR